MPGRPDQLTRKIEGQPQAAPAITAADGPLRIVWGLHAELFEPALRQRCPTPLAGGALGQCLRRTAVKRDRRQMAPIEIADRFSLVEIPESAVDEVIQALKHSTIKGKKPTVRRERGTPPTRGYKKNAHPGKRK